MTKNINHFFIVTRYVHTNSYHYKVPVDWYVMASVVSTYIGYT